jgi:hypothetical protein
MQKQFLLAVMAAGVLSALTGCSGGGDDNTSIVINAPTGDTGGSTGGGDTGGETGGGDTGGETAVECPSFTTEIASGVCELPATISSDATLVAGVDYLMTGRVTVGNGNGELGADGNLLNGTAVQNVTLTIEPGVEIKGRNGTFANLVITRGSKIMAMGTAADPIIFSSEDAGYDGAGEWGGLIIHGYAPHNVCPENGTVCNIDSEGESGFAAGYDAEDNSGVLQYVIVAEGGYEFAPGNEINGISLIGVGSGTTMEYIQVEGNSDDGIEFYGGNVNLKYGVFTNNLDDSVDWDEGYQGNLQYIIVSQSPEGSGEAFEMDTQGSDFPLSKPTVANLTVIADKRANDDNFIMNFKAGSGGFFHNAVVTVAPDNNTPLDTCVQINGADSQALVNTALVFNNWIQDCAASPTDQGTLGTDAMNDSTIFRAFADLDSNAASQAPEAKLAAPLNWADINAAFSESEADASFLDATDYIGAVDPDATSAWWQGWTLPGTVNVPEVEAPPVATCPAWTTTVDNGCALPATIDQDRTLIAGLDYFMEGRVTVGNGNGELGADGNLLDGTAVQNVTLTIEPGVEIKGRLGTFANMVITRGSKIIADGTKSQPIIFSSEDAGYDGSGEFGGLIIHGYAPHNVCPETGTTCNIDSEGESGFAGGYDPLDDSGVLRYVIVAEGGYEFAPGNEINGISLIGVGSGTTMEYIQVQGNSDDGIEFYGGTVNLKYGVFTNNLDDSVDWDEGYQGNLQYIIVKQSPNGGGEAFEMDTQGSDFPLSKPTLANVTVVADKRDADDSFIMNFKAGSGGFFHNTVVTVAEGNNTPLDTCVRVNGVDSEALVGTALVLNNWIQDCGVTDQGVLSTDNVNLDNGTIFAVPAQLGALYESQAPEASGLAPLNWAEINAALPESVADPEFLDATDFIGAVNPDGSDPWWAGWILNGTL